jgi:hypothetical protein
MIEQNRRLENQGVCPNYLTTYMNINLFNLPQPTDERALAICAFTVGLIFKKMCDRMVNIR